MKTEKTITICGKEVKLLYCAATENGYEQLAGQSINDLDFRKQSDLLKLALAAIISAYSRDKQEPPITDSDLLYNAEPKDITQLIIAVIELRAEWYNVPLVVANKSDNVKQADDEKTEEQKNAQPPTTATN